MTFKPSKLTPGFNLTWEGSRMMLPEHVAALNKMKREKQKRTKPEFDEQYLNELAMKIAEAKQEEYIVTINIFDEYEDHHIEGRIVALDVQLRKLKIVSDDESVWAYFDDILAIEKN